MTRRRSHGKSRTKVYVAWVSMINRCDNPRAFHYSEYGGRGIRACDEWHTFVNFYRDMGEPPTKEHSLDRIDVNGNYCKENCRWADKRTQSNNRRSRVSITINGETKNLSEWAKVFGISANRAFMRYYRGMPTEKIFEKKLLNRRILNHDMEKITKAMQEGAADDEISKTFGISMRAIDKLRRGITYRRWKSL